MNAVATTARFESNKAHDFTKGALAVRPATLQELDVAQLKTRVPSMFAATAMPGVSAQYQFVKTIDVINTMRDAGYAVVAASQSKAMTEDGHEYVKHQARLVHKDYVGGRLAVGDTVPEVSIVNSHNRTSAFVLRTALRRLACNNGLMVAAGDFGAFRVLHTDKNIHDHIIDGTHLIKEVHKVHALPTIEKMQAKQLTDAQARDFALAATLLKWGEFRENHVEPLLAVRREEDDARDLWTVLNRVQENAVKGGYKTTDRANRNVTAAGIQAVDRDIDFNSRLWTLGTKILELA